MTKRTLLILFLATGILSAMLVPQPFINGHQRITRQMAEDTYDNPVISILKGGISFKITGASEWVSMSLDGGYDRVLYCKSYLQDGERTSDAINDFDDEATLIHPGGICFDTRASGDYYYFFVSLPEAHKIKRYYYDRSDEKIYSDDEYNLGSSYTPAALAFCEGGSSYNDDWLVYTNSSSTDSPWKVVIKRFYPSGNSDLVYTASEFGGMIKPLSVAIGKTDTDQRRIYIADTYQKRIIMLLVEKSSSSNSPVVVSSKVFNLPKGIYPAAIACIGYPEGEYGLYVLDQVNGRLYVLDYTIDGIIATYNLAINDPVQITSLEGETVVSEAWTKDSGLQYFWEDCELNNLNVTPPVLTQGSYPWIQFYLTGQAYSVTATVKNSQGTTVKTMVWNDLGADIFSLAMVDVDELPTGSYTVIVNAVDPDTGTELYPLHSADTSDFIITPAYTLHGFEINERACTQNSFLFNNCCSSITGEVVTGIPLNPSHAGSKMFKLSAYDNSSDEIYDCVDCKLFDNCGIAITTPTFLSCWIKATEAPGDADSLYVSLDGIIVDDNYSWQQLKNWTKYGKILDQRGDLIHSGYHPVPVDSEWHYYVFSLNPAAGETIKILQFSYWGVPSTATGQFTAYLDDISITSNHPWNMWYAETYGNGGSGHSNSDPNFELGMKFKHEDGSQCYGGARIIVDDNGDGGEGSHWLSPFPSIRKDIHPYMELGPNTQVGWMQYDKAHALLLGFLIDDNWLYYGWNAPGHWAEQGYVDMSDETQTQGYDCWQTFSRNIYEDYLAEYPEASSPQEVKAYRIMHYCKSDWDGDSGGTVRGPVFTDGSQTPPQPPVANAPILKQPNGGEKWSGGFDHIYMYKLGTDLPKRVRVWWTSYYNTSSPVWELVDVHDYYPPPPGVGWPAYVGGKWHTPVPPTPPGKWQYCAFRTEATDLSNNPLFGQTDVSDATFTIMRVTIGRLYTSRQDPFSIPQIPGQTRRIDWYTNGVCGVQGVDLYYTTMGGLSEEELRSRVMTGSGDTIWHQIATGLTPGTWGPIDSIYDPETDSTFYEYAYTGHYDNWTIPNTPTSGGNLKLVAYDTLGDTAVYIMDKTFNIAFPGGTQFATAYTADKIATDGSTAHIVFTNNSGNVIYSSNPDTYEWTAPESVAVGSKPTLTLDGSGDPCVSWVAGPENVQNLYYSKRVRGAWETPTMISQSYASGLTRFSEPTIRYTKNDTIRVSAFKAKGYMNGPTPTFSAIGLLNTRFALSTPGTRHTDTMWGTIGDPLDPVSTAPAYILDSYGKEHYAFNYGDSTIYIQPLSASTHWEIITTSPAMWPCLTATRGNVYLTYGTVVSGSMRLVQRWKHPNDTIWRGTDTLYRGPLAYFNSVGGALNLLEKSDGTVMRLSYDAIEHKTDTVNVADSSYYGHCDLHYNSLSSGLPLVWTQRSGSSYYVSTDWHDPEQTIFPDYYIQAGGALTPYTQHRDTIIQYYNLSVDRGVDSVRYRLEGLDPCLTHTLFTEFYFEDDSIPYRHYIVKAGSVAETIEVYSRFRARATLGIPAGDSELVITVTSDSGSVEVSRLMLYQGEDVGQQLMGSSAGQAEKITYVLFQNFPNPFTSETTVKYALPYDRSVSLKVYDISGRLVKTLVNERKGPGVYSITWDGKDNTNLRLASGVYFIRFETEDFNQTKKAVLIK